MQYVSGVRMPIFWGVSIIWDMITTTIVVFVIIAMLLLGHQSVFKTPVELLSIFLIFFMYNFAMTPVICVWSLIFTKPSFGRAFVTIFNVIIGEFFFFCPKYNSLNLTHFISTPVPALYLINVLIRVWASDLDSQHYDTAHFFLWPYPLVTLFDCIYRLEMNHHLSVFRMRGKSHPPWEKPLKCFNRDIYHLQSRNCIHLAILAFYWI